MFNIGRLQIVGDLDVSFEVIVRPIKLIQIEFDRWSIGKDHDSNFNFNLKVRLDRFQR